MATSSSSQPVDAQIWSSLKQAISESSGFKHWMSDRKFDVLNPDLDKLVYSYLRETLETLAY